MLLLFVRGKKKKKKDFPAHKKKREEQERKGRVYSGWVMMGGVCRTRKREINGKEKFGRLKRRKRG